MKKENREKLKMILTTRIFMNKSTLFLVDFIFKIGYQRFYLSYAVKKKMK
jgi:hypothetical protein